MKNKNIQFGYHPNGNLTRINALHVRIFFESLNSEFLLFACIYLVKLHICMRFSYKFYFVFFLFLWFDIIEFCRRTRKNEYTTKGYNEWNLELIELFWDSCLFYTYVIWYSHRWIACYKTLDVGLESAETINKYFQFLQIINLQRNRSPQVRKTIYSTIKGKPLSHASWYDNDIF